METHHPWVGQYGAHVSPIHPDWGPSFGAGICALIAGPAMGLSLVAVAVWAAGAVDGWPTTSPSVSSSLFPQLGLGAAPAAIAVAVSAFVLDASVRRRVFRRIARSEISLAAAMVSIPLSPGLWLVTGIHSPVSWPISVALGVAFLRWRACAECAVSLPPISRAAWAAAGVILAVGATTGTALIDGGPHLASAGDGGLDVIGARPSGSDGLSDWWAWPLDSVVGHRASRVLYYRFDITGAGPLPLTVGAVSAHTSGPGLHVLATRVVRGRPAHHRLRGRRHGAGDAPRPSLPGRCHGVGLVRRQPEHALFGARRPGPAIDDVPVATAAPTDLPERLTPAPSSTAARPV